MTTPSFTIRWRPPGDDWHATMHFDSMTCSQFCEMMADAIAGAGEHFDIDARQIGEWVIDRVPASMDSSFERKA